jgi:hypothetical protein
MEPAMQIEDEEPLRELNEVADWRWAGIVATGETIAWRELRSYLEKRVSGKKVRRPNARKPAV